MSGHSHSVCVAPMMDRTDRHFRYLMRLISPRTFLYTEMITAHAIVHGNARALLGFDAIEHPVGVQLGGAEPDLLARAARVAVREGYDEINLNVGCPSDRVRAGAFGVALMREPALVADCVRAMRAAAGRPVTVKTRIGVDHDDDYAFLRAFAESAAAGGCRTLIIHARKAWLNGLSPRENREIPPLDHSRVHRLKRDFPELEIIVNGGIRSVSDALASIGPADGCMLGRAAYDNPLVVRDVEMAVLGPIPAPPVTEVVDRYIGYVERTVLSGAPIRRVARHLMGLMAGRPGARAWRRMLGTLPGGDSGIAVLRAGQHEFRSELESVTTSDTVAGGACLHSAIESRYNAARFRTRVSGGHS